LHIFVLLFTTPEPNGLASLSQIHTNAGRTIYSFLITIDDDVNGVQLDTGNRAEMVPSAGNAALWKIPTIPSALPLSGHFLVIGAENVYVKRHTYGQRCRRCFADGTKADLCF